MQTANKQINQSMNLSGPLKLPWGWLPQSTCMLRNLRTNYVYKLTCCCCCCCSIIILTRRLHAEGYEHFSQFVTFFPHPSLSLSGPPFLLIVVMGLGSITFNTSLFIYLFCRHLLSLLHSLSLCFVCQRAGAGAGQPDKLTNHVLSLLKRCWLLSFLTNLYRSDHRALTEVDTS